MNKDAAFPLAPEVNDQSRGYWEGTVKGELRMQTCDNCSTMRFPEAPVCPNCLSPDATWQPVSGNGNLWSWIVMHQKAFRSYADQVPYMVAFIELDEGPFMMSALVDAPDDLRCGMRVTVEFVELDAERSAPVFRVVA
jgi:uncharacterized OB-fold protein